MILYRSNPSRVWSAQTSTLGLHDPGSTHDFVITENKQLCTYLVLIGVHTSIVWYEFDIIAISILISIIIAMAW